MNRTKAVDTLLIDDDRVRVTRFDFEAGSETGWHQHEYDYVITAIVDCPIMLEESDGSSREVLVPAGTAYRRVKGIKHNVINNGASQMSFIEMELK